MKVRKAIKKVAALGMGVSMLGATVLGAVAADLSDYPSNMVKNGAFDGVIVLGDNAIAADTLGAIDIATGLQFSGGSSGGDFSVSNGYQLGSTGDDLNIGENLSGVEQKLDDSELPGVLSDGIFDESEGNNDNEETYTQEIEFGVASGEFLLDQDDQDAPDGQLYLKFDNSDLMYNYTLEFDDEVDYDNTSSTTAEDDFETAKLEILGSIYTITNVKLASGVIDEIKLQAGDTTIWLEQGIPITRVIGGEEREVELVDVNENEDKCGVIVDGVLQWVDVGSQEKVNGVEVGVTEAITVHSEAEDTDVCEVNLGSLEVVLEANDEVEVNAKEVDGSNVNFVETTKGKLEEIQITYEPDDEVYLGAGDSWVDPIFGSWEITYAGDSANYEEMSFSVSGDDLEFEFLNSDGREIVLPFFCTSNCDDSSAEIVFGTDSDIDEKYYLNGETCQGTSDVEDCEGARFLVIEGDELHIVELDDIDLSENETTLEDVTYGGSKDTDNSIDETFFAMDLPAGGKTVLINVSTAGNNVTFGNAYFVNGTRTAASIASDHIVGPGEEWETLYEAKLSMNRSSGTNIGITLNESEGEVDSTSGNEDSRGTVNMTISRDTGDDEELNIDAPVPSNNAKSGGVEVNDDNDDERVYYSKYGTKFVHDDEDKRALTVWFPEEELFANVFVSTAGANVVASGGGAQRVEVGAAKLASEVASLDAQNTIIVGGPCANAAAAEFLGVSQATCLEGAPEENTAVIKLKDMGDNVAMLVNGYSAIDTRRAARVLANYNDHALSGDEVVVTGTDFSNIVVSTV